MATEVSQSQARAPQPGIDVPGWLRKNLFSTWYNSLISIVLLVIVFQVVTGFFQWAFTTEGWIAAASNGRLILVGRYPAAELWRPQLALALVAVLLGLSGGVWRGIAQALTIGFAGMMLVLTALWTQLPPANPPAPLTTELVLVGIAALVGGAYAAGRAGGERLRWPIIAGWFLAYPMIILILQGFGGATVPTNLWGGLMLTMLLSVSGIVLSFPLGVLLALGRRSSLPVVKFFCVVYIELIRGVPLITVLFMAQLMLPLFLPSEVRIDAVVRAVVAVTLFSAAYLAENVRGGLQSIPKGQVEAARALGLNVVKTTLLITLPQALKAVIPVLVGQFISLFKDTSLVAIIGLLDLLGVARAINTQPEWLGFPGGVWRETFFVVAVIYWIFSFTMSRSSRQIEANLNRGAR
ncbi:amino acid ABC transporter permease [Candidatus Chloroploca sp. Khr17]|uniref:amino acid ABC transporter permease n=1 Tax=Candidatus Chloroploca sp. Khr17 TaxID=2496869 RepID=UPI00101DB07C|nr:amino acid ABC transporter permease [Candidatus Chloroploca sp. Khr17]